MATDPTDLRGPGAASPLLVLNTKLHAPSPRANRVHRQRLLDRLEAGSRSALALVSAPAGFGKSTLIGDWLSRRPQPSAWLSLDAGDSDLRRFLAYMVAALDRPLPGVGRGVAAALTASHLPAADVLLTPLLNELWDKPGCYLVLDDYHVIQAPEVHEALTFLLEHLPPEMHLILATRVDPPLPLPRLRARNLLCELRAEDLRFTHEEAALFLRETMGLDVAAHEVQALESRTEGWVAGLQMAALSLQGRDDVSAFIAGFTGSHRFVLDYLSEEVLDRQPPERMEFLLRTSILGRMSGPLCDAVTGGTAGTGGIDGQEILESLETANLFLIPLDDRRGWYRYHHLFASLLQGELSRRVSEPELADLHARASGWFADHGLPDEAMEHAVAAGDWERAVRIIEAHANPFIHRGELATIRRWFNPLPEEIYRAHPRLLMTRALLSFAAFRFPEFAATLQEMERACEISDDPVLSVGLDSMRALMLSAQGDHAGVVAFAGRALERMPEEDDSGAGRGLLTLLLGMSLGCVGQSRRALEVLEESASITTAIGNLVLAVLARAQQGRIEILSGRLRRGLERYRQALDLFASFGDTPLPAASQAWSGVAEVHLEMEELDQALECALTANRLSRSGEVAGHHVKGLATMIRVRIARSEFDEARQVYEELLTYMRRTHTDVWDVLNESLCHRIDVRQAKREGRRDLLSKVQRWAEERGLMQGWDDLRSRLMPDLPKDFAHMTVAHWLHACGRHREMLQLLAALRQVAEEEGLGSSLIEIDLLQALVLRELGEPGALEFLERSLDRAEPEGYLHVFVKEGEPLARLLEEYGRERPGALDRPLVRRLRELAGSPAPAPAAPRVHPSEEPLSDRELEVLRSVASGLSNAEAARRLYLSPFTVKKHLENIYGKLGVRNRTEAIAKVQALGLLTPPGA